MTRSLALVAVLLPFLWGCGGSLTEDAQQVIRYGGLAVREVDTVVAPLYTAQHATVLAEAPDLQSYNLRMAPWNTLETALRLSYSAFVAADHAIEAGGQLGLRSLACLLASLSVVTSALTSLHLEPPEVLVEAMRLGSSFTGECTEEPRP